MWTFGKELCTDLGKLKLKLRQRTTITGDFPVPNSKYLSSGIFAQDEASLFDNKLKINFGGRYDLIKVTNDNALNPSYIID